MKIFNKQIKKRAMWICRNSEWEYGRALEVLKAILIEYMQGHQWSIYMWIDFYYEKDFGKSISFTRKNYENAFNPF